MTTATSGFVTVTFHLDHDFNSGRNEGGFHEVVVDQVMESLVRRGMVVTLSDGEVSQRGRIRCLVAIVEDVSDDDGSSPNHYEGD